jgi:predicted transcriptional regulator
MRLKPCIILLTILDNEGCSRGGETSSKNHKAPNIDEESPPLSISTIYKKSGDAQTMYGYVMNIIHEFRDAGMVETQKSGRTLSVHLTKKGIEIAKLVKLINEKLRAGVQECRKARNGTEC